MSYSQETPVRTIDIKNLFIKTDQGNDKHAYLFLKSLINKAPHKARTEEEFIKCGGNPKILSKPANTVVEVYSDKKYTYPYNVICNSCKQQGEPLTPNLPGIVCNMSKTSKAVSMNIKVVCANCQKNKNSYINITTLPNDIVKYIYAKNPTMQPNPKSSSDHSSSKSMMPGDKKRRPKMS